MVTNENKDIADPNPGCVVRGFDTRRMGRLLHPAERTQALPVGPSRHGSLASTLSAIGIAALVFCYQGTTLNQAIK